MSHQYSPFPSEIPHLTFSGPKNNNSDYVGESGEIVMESDSTGKPQFYVHDGHTPGGFLMIGAVAELAEKARLYTKGAFLGVGQQKTFFYDHAQRVVDKLLAHGVTDEVTMAAVWVYGAMLAEIKFSPTDIEEELGLTVKTLAENLIWSFQDNETPDQIKQYWSSLPPTAQTVRYAILIDSVKTHMSLSGQPDTALIESMETSLELMELGEESLRNEAFAVLYQWKK